MSDPRAACCAAIDSALRADQRRRRGDASTGGIGVRQRSHGTASRARLDDTICEWRHFEQRRIRRMPTV
jgi:hypothetical protein